MIRADAAPRFDFLSIRDLSVSFETANGSATAVRSVSLDLAPGETLAIVGESGCGKSLLCRSVTRLLPAGALLSETASIQFEGRELTRLREPELSRVRGRRIGMIFQDPAASLNPVMTIGRQIAEPLMIHRGLTGKSALNKAGKLLSSVGMPDPDERLGRYPHQLSGGQCQRVQIAIAIAATPVLLIADEPTTALDVTVQARILDLLARLQADIGMAMILVTHDLGIARRQAHQITVMYAGRIVEQAPADRLLRQVQHPYTRALAQAAPRLDRPSRTPLAVTAGSPPHPAHLPEGCAFAPRCGQARKRCRHTLPELLPVGPAHAAACHYPLGKTAA